LAIIRRAVNGGHGRKHLQFLDELPHLEIRCRGEFLGPVHRHAVDDSPCESH
jgi:hypothetical protein